MGTRGARSAAARYSVPFHACKGSSRARDGRTIAASAAAVAERAVPVVVPAKEALRAQIDIDIDIDIDDRRAPS